MGLWYIYYELVAMGLQSRYSKDKSTISINYTETIPIVHGDCKPTHTTFVDTSIWLVTTHFQGTGQDGTALLRVRSTAGRRFLGFQGKQRLVYFMDHAHKKWMIWGYPYFRKPPYGFNHQHMVIHVEFQQQGGETLESDHWKRVPRVRVGLDLPKRVIIIIPHEWWVTTPITH